MKDDSISHFIKKLFAVFSFPCLFGYGFSYFIRIQQFRTYHIQITIITFAAVCLLLRIFDKKKSLVIYFHRFEAFTILGLIIPILAVLALKDSHLFYVDSLPEWILFSYVQVVSVLSIFIYLDKRYFLDQMKTSKVHVLFASLLPIAALVSYLIKESWEILAKPTTYCSYLLLKAIGFEMIKDPNPFLLTHAITSVRVWKPCSGVEGIFLFISIFLVVLLFDYKKYALRKIVCVFLAGILMMFCLNVIRISTIVGVGIILLNKYGPQQTIHLMLGIVHNHFGWIFMR